MTCEPPGLGTLAVSLFVLVAALVFAAFLAASHIRRAQADSLPDPRVFFVGDSFASGLARPLASELRATGRLLSADAHRGRTALSVNRILREKLRAPEFGLLIVSAGANDCRKPVASCTLFPKLAREIVEQARAASVPVVWLEPPELPWQADAMREAIHASGARVIRAPKNLERAGDKVHLTSRGYRHWAAHIRKELGR